MASRPPISVLDPPARPVTPVAVAQRAHQSVPQVSASVRPRRGRMAQHAVQAAASALLLVLAGCSTTAGDRSAQGLLAAELVCANPGTSILRSSEPEVVPDSTTVSRMQHEAARRGQHLLAVAFVTTGVHPWYAVAFLDRGGRVAVVGTAVSWGRVNEKCQSLVERSDYVFFLEQSRSNLTCGARWSDNDWGFGAWLVVVTPAGVESECRADWGSQQASELSIALDGVLKAGGGWVCRGVPYPHAEVPDQR
jgi:hypothetical protein